VSQWFYAEGNRERRGPLPSENIVELHRSGRIDADTLLWRDGAGDWRPLRDFAAELGIAPPAAADTDAPASAAPLPPPLQQVPRYPAAAATPKQGLSGCAIAAIIGAIVAVIGLAILAILAAIALPAYKDYQQRARASMVYTQLQPLSSDIAGFAAANERCPVNGEDGFGSPESYASGNLGSVRVGRFEDGHCGLEAQFNSPHEPALHGKTLWLDYDMRAATWECSSDVDDKYLPANCRG